MIKIIPALFFFCLAAMQGTFTYMMYQQTGLLYLAIACWTVTAFLTYVGVSILIENFRH